MGRSRVDRSASDRFPLAVLLFALVGVFALAAGPGDQPGTPAATAPTPQAPARAVIVSRSTTGPVLSLTIACRRGSPGEVCSGPITLSSQGTPTVEKIGSNSYSVATGEQTTVPVFLNSTGVAMLSEFPYRLPATLTLAGTTAISSTVHFRYRRITSPVAFDMVFAPRWTTFEELRVTRVPADATVGVNCTGHGCPLSAENFSPSGGKVALGPSFRGSQLAPGTTVEISVTASDSIGEVEVFTIRSGAQPTTVIQCLPPDSTGPTRCA